MGLDYLVATRMFDREWTPFDYVVPGVNLFALELTDKMFFRTMLLVALPFIACGVALTVRRLRSAGLPVYAVVLFFAPLPLNLIVFLALSMLPPRPVHGATTDLIDEERRPLDSVKKPGVIGKAIPEDRMRGAIMSIVLPFPFAVALGVLCFNVLKNYGWGVFIGIPFALPMISVILYGYHSPRKLKECLWLGMLWLAVAYAACLVLLVEGMICLVMALPLFVPIVLLGSAVGYLIQSRPMDSAETTRLLLVLIAALPLLIGAESAAGPAAPVFVLSTSIEVEATPERVWDHIIQFDPLPCAR